MLQTWQLFLDTLSPFFGHRLHLPRQFNKIPYHSQLFDNKQIISYADNMIRPEIYHVPGLFWYVHVPTPSASSLERGMFR